MLLSPQNTVCIALLCFFFPLFFFSLSLAFSLLLSLSPSPRLPLSPHLMRPHNNTAVVQLFCYLSQTAGSLHSVFLVPFTCLLRQGNEYHLELQSTSPQKGWSVISGYTSEAFGWGSKTSNQSISSIVDLLYIFTSVQCENDRTQDDNTWKTLKSIVVVNSTLA